MKINEVVTEGILGTVAGVAGNLAKGIGKGVADAIAPGAVDKIKGAKYAYDNRVRTSSADANSGDYQDTTQARNLHTKMLSDRGLRDRLQAAANKLEQQARANGNTIDPKDVKQGMHDAGLAEAIRESVDSDAEYHYIVSLLQDAGITVTGYVAPTDTVAAADAASAASQAHMAAATAASERFSPANLRNQAIAKKERFIAMLKQQADRQGSISMTDIGIKIPKQGEYADANRRRQAIQHVAQELQKQGVTVTSTNTPTATPAPAATTPNIGNTRRTPAATAPLPTIGGIGPSDPRYAALAARTRNAPPTPVR